MIIYFLLYHIKFEVGNFCQDDRGTPADAPDNPAILAVKKIREVFPDLLVACDVCLCPYTDHGHCGILNPDGTINNPPSIERIADVALAYAKAGKCQRTGVKCCTFI